MGSRVPSRLAVVVLSILSARAAADEVRVAVVADFAAPMQTIAAAFERGTHHVVRLTADAGPALMERIRSGEPFELLLAADQEGPRSLVAAGQAGPGFTYALDRLVLWSPAPERVDPDGRVLGASTFDTLAVADPATSPEGAAAVQVLGALGLQEALRPKLAVGGDPGQVYASLLAKRADLGFVALARVIDDRVGSGWIVPESLHAPIRRAAVLIGPGREQAGARALAEYLRGPESRTIIESHGYGLDQIAPAPATPEQTRGAAP